MSETFEAEHGRPPMPVEAIELAQQATLQTRPAKHEPQCEAEQRESWRSIAAAVLGGMSRSTAMIDAATHAQTDTACTATAACVRTLALRGGGHRARAGRPGGVAALARPRRDAARGAPPRACPPPGWTRSLTRLPTPRWASCRSGSTGRALDRAGGVDAARTERACTPSPAPSCTPRAPCSTAEAARSLAAAQREDGRARRPQHRSTSHCSSRPRTA